MKLSLLLLAPLLAHSHEDHLHSYQAVLSPLGNATVDGTVTVIIAQDRVFYGGFLTGLEPLLAAEDCTATNACGVHIHAGRGCEDAAAQGGHFYETDEDPWLTEMYTSDENGYALVNAWLDIGTTDVFGRAFVVHDATGARIACGTLELIMSVQSKTEPLGDSNVHGSVVVVPATQGSTNADLESAELVPETRLCYAGYASGLETMLSSVHGGNDGTDCTETNGCGTHVHEGMGCADKEAQGGHWYEGEEDPWKILGYLETDGEGAALYGACVDTGIDVADATGRAFIVHNSAGGRVSCGIIGGVVEEKGEDDEAEGISSVSLLVASFFVSLTALHI